MNTLIEIQNRIRRFVAAHELLSARVMRGILTFLCLAAINAYYGYATYLGSPFLIIGLSALGAIMPVSGTTLVMIVYLLIELYSLSPKVSLVALILYVAAYAICGYYSSRHTYNLIAIPVGYPIQLSFAGPLISALTGGISEITSVVCGGVISYYLAVCRRNSSTLLETGGKTSFSQLIISNMFGSSLFYFYMLSLIGLFLVAYMIREKIIHHSWHAAVGAGLLAEFVIMLAAYLTTANTNRIPQLILMNLIMVVVGTGFSLFVKNLDYTRVERVQFEDDDYYYYVTAVPKIRVEEESRKLKHITRTEPKRGRHSAKRPMPGKNQQDSSVPQPQHSMRDGSIPQPQHSMRDGNAPQPQQAAQNPHHMTHEDRSGEEEARK